MTDVFMTTHWLTERTGRHRSTIARWRREARVPPELERLARLELAGELELIHANWAGWTIEPKTGALVTPGGVAYAAGELHCLPIMRQRIDALERELGLKRRRRTFLEKLTQLFRDRKERRRKAKRPSTLDAAYTAGWAPAVRQRPR